MSFFVYQCFGRYLGKIKMPKSTNRRETKNMSIDGLTMIDGWSTDYSKIVLTQEIGNRRRVFKPGQTKKKRVGWRENKVDIDKDNVWFTANSHYNNPFFAFKNHRLVVFFSAKHRKYAKRLMSLKYRDDAFDPTPSIFSKNRLVTRSLIIESREVKRLRMQYWSWGKIITTILRSTLTIRIKNVH